MARKHRKQLDRVPLSQLTVVLITALLSFTPTIAAYQVHVGELAEPSPQHNGTYWRRRLSAFNWFDRQARDDLQQKVKIANRHAARGVSHAHSRDPHCDRPDAPIIFYNRVPKCASTTMLRLLEKLERANHFVFKLQRQSDRYRQPEEDQLSQLARLCGPIVYANHQRYADPNQYPGRWPKLEKNLQYFNVVRDPFSRANSAFHYAVNIDLRHDRARKVIESRRKDRCGCHAMSFSQCVERAEEMDCPQNLQIGSSKDTIYDYILDDRLLAGFDLQQDCKDRMEGKVEGVSPFVNASIDFIKERYIFVGIAERFRLGLKVLETKMPDFFTRAPDLSDNIPKQRSGHEAKLSAKAREILEAHPCNLNEKVFYEKVVEYFWEEVDRLGIETRARRKLRKL